MNARIPEPCLCGALDCRACRGSDARPDTDDDDCTADTIEEMRGLLDDAEMYWEQGKGAKALQSLRALRDKLNKILGGDMDRRQRRAMRQFIELVRTMVEIGEMDTRQAADEMKAQGVPFGVALRTLTGRKI